MSWTLVLLGWVAANALADEGFKHIPEQKKLEGSWRVVSWESHGGKKYSARPGETFRFVFAEDRVSMEWYVLGSRDGAPDPRIYVLDVGANPKRIDLYHIEPELTLLGPVCWGMYEMKGQRLKIVLASRGERPTVFAGRDDGHTLYLLVREPKR